MGRYLRTKVHCAGKKMAVHGTVHIFFLFGEVQKQLFSVTFPTQPVLHSEGGLAIAVVEVRAT